MVETHGLVIDGQVVAREAGFGAVADPSARRPSSTAVAP